MRALGRLLAFIVVASLIGSIWFGYAIFADRSHPASATHLIVARGSSFHDIADQLASKSVIGNAFAFRLYAKLFHRDTQVRAGEYKFLPGLRQSEVLDQLLTGGAQIATWVTFPEGFTARQIAQRLAGEGFGPASRFSEAFLHDAMSVDGARTKNLEGYLFPSTYLIPIGATPAQVEQVMTSQFFKELPADARRRSEAHGLSVPEVVTVASLVQQEGKADSERPLIAGVIYNRLRLHMPLQVDATLEYTFPEHRTVILNRDLQTDSPYNTYKHEGLPPTPIANPGAPSLAAAFHPKASAFLYYVYKGNGHHAFAKTLAEHQANVARYLK
ncbi:MAG: endolytic transglycosylase MltG [Candidatus Eremiobacteraeota bacterium]|nr:endolytic transglycosylase MltG [Candidatus Eremiobacteraeota bacterium]